MENSITVLEKNSLQRARSITGDLYSRFINYLDASPKTIATYSRNLKPFFTWLAENGITAPTFEDCKSYRDEIASSHSPATTQAYTFVVRRFFDWTKSLGLYPDVAGKLKGAKISREPKKDYLSSSQCKAVLSGINAEDIQGKRNYAILCLMLTGGLRDIEVCRANVEDLRTVGDNTVLYLQGKGKQERTDFVIIPEQTERAIREYLKARGTQEDAEPLFTSESNNSKGKRMSTRSISGIAKEAMRNAGYDSERLTAHSLRHTAVTLALIANGGNIQEAQQFARHASIATTTIYAHNLEKQNNKCSRLVADSIF